ncbi:MAG: C39 family peptidase [Anaerolineaceae bacterium]|nr:C39 family peptidase [Anaerolineaceae bacterium]
MKKKGIIFAFIMSLTLFVTVLLFTSVNGQTSPPEEAYVSGLVGYAQSHTLSCESRAAVDWATFFGVYLTENQFLYALPSSDDPELGFVGNADGYWGSIPPYDYGVHAAPVAALLNEFGMSAIAQKHLTWETLQREIASGYPVIVWVIGPLWDGTPIKYQTKAGNDVIVAHYEHAMILRGYDGNIVYLLDPSTGTTRTYSLESFLSSWSILESQAVLYKRPEPTPTPTQTPTMIPTALPTPINQITIQRGDTLLGIVQRYNVTWQEITTLNNLSYPYFIYPGNVLFLK